MTDEVEDEEPVQVFIASPEVVARIEASFWLAAVEAGATLGKLHLIADEFVPPGQIYCFPHGLPDLEAPIKSTQVYDYDWERAPDSLDVDDWHFTFPPLD